MQTSCHHVLEGSFFAEELCLELEQVFIMCPVLQRRSTCSEGHVQPCKPCKWFIEIIVERAGHAHFRE